MRRRFPLLILVALPLLATAQFEVGHLSHTFLDPSRGNRPIPCEVYYPAQSAGDLEPAADGQFPVFVFGHGFVMQVDVYENLWSGLVPQGFILVLPTTEGLIPDHEEFGRDLAFASQAMGALGDDAGSLLSGHVADGRALGGHSMGGGATWLAAAGNGEVDCIVGLAPAETDPSAVTAGAEITAPALVISGSEDGVTPPAQHHIPIYSGTASACRYFVSLEGGSHCYFANPGSLCEFGEPSPGPMSRAIQQQLTNDLLLHWLRAFLLDDAVALDELQDLCGSNPALDCTVACSTAAIDTAGDALLRTGPNPFDASVQCTTGFPEARFRAMDMTGRALDIRWERGVQQGTWIVHFPSAMAKGAVFLFEEVSGSSAHLLHAEGP